jgi:hypothetical protein
MKSTWEWIIAILFAIWIFSGDKKNKPTVPANPPTYTQKSYIQPSNTNYAVPTFKGYPCTVDCSGHDAGYEWAEENSINDPDDCDGNSNSFIEGCQSYAEEQKSDEELESNEE